MFYQDRQAADPEDKAYRLPRWVSGNSKKLYTTPFETSLGILASDATLKAKEKGLSEKVAYNNRPNLIVIRGTENVYIGDITVRNPAFHTVAVLDSKNVTSNNVKYTTYDSNNADGIELGNTQNAIVFNNFFDTGDDSINFATGMGKGVQDCEQKPSQNIWTFNNFLREGHGGAIAAGSHTGAGICNMLVEDNVLKPQRYAIPIQICSCQRRRRMGCADPRLCSGRMQPGVCNEHNLQRCKIRLYLWSLLIHRLNSAISTPIILRLMT